MRYVLDAEQMQTKEEAHIYLKKVLELPEYYGMNLDALYDVMTEREGIEVEIQNMTEDNICAKVIFGVLKEANVNIK